MPPPPGWSPPGSAGGGGADGGGRAAGGAAAGGGARGAGSGAGAGGQSTQGGSGAASTSPDSGAAASQGNGSTRPVLDPSTNMYYVVGPRNVRYYIDSESGLLINSETRDVSDPKTGKIVYTAKDLEAASGGDSGAGAGAGAGSGNGRMQKRSVRHRKV